MRMQTGTIAVVRTVFLLLFCLGLGCSERDGRGGADAGSLVRDAGSNDAGPEDDAGAVAADAGSNDAGSFDAGTFDAGDPDAGTVDAGSAAGPDGGPPEGLPFGADCMGLAAGACATGFCDTYDEGPFCFRSACNQACASHDECTRLLEEAGVERPSGFCGGDRCDLRGSGLGGEVCE